VLNKVLQRRHVVHLDSRHSRPLKRTVNKFAIGFRRQLTTWHCPRFAAERRAAARLLRSIGLQHGRRYFTGRTAAQPLAGVGQVRRLERLQLASGLCCSITASAS